MRQLYQVFVANGASLAEINPLITTPDGQVLALDAKISVDDNELDRRPDLAALRDDSAEEPSEVAGRARRDSPSSSWTATWAAWSTAPGWPWPRWTW